MVLLVMKDSGMGFCGWHFQTSVMLLVSFGRALRLSQITKDLYGSDYQFKLLKYLGFPHLRQIARPICLE